MTTFKEIKIGNMFHFKNSLSSSHWLKTNNKTGVCIGSDKKEYQLNQEKRFCPNEIVYKFPNKIIMTEEQKAFRKELSFAVKKFNNALNDEYLEQFSTTVLIGFTHPTYREDWQKKYNKIFNVVSDGE